MVWMWCSTNSTTPCLLQNNNTFQQHFPHPSISLPCELRPTISTKNMTQKSIRPGTPLVLYCSSTESSSVEYSSTTTSVVGPPVKKKRKRYRKQYPGENKGITEELRFVAMRLRNIKGKRHSATYSDHDEDDDKSESDDTQNSFIDGDKANEDGDDNNRSSSSDGETTWKPSMEGFVKYLVDSKLVFDTVERIVDESSDVSYAYFRKTGLERSESLSKDLESFRQQDIVIPEPSSQGVSYVSYLEKLAEKSAPLFLSHFYNIYFAHIAGGQVIGRQVSEQLLEGRELEFYIWEEDVLELLKVVREKLNLLGEHWSRDEKNRCLKEATKAFRFLGQIVRLIIL